METGHHGDPVRSEKSDAHAGATVRAMAALAVVTALTAAALIPMFAFLRNFVGRADSAMPPSRFESGRRPPKPWLQEEPFGDLQALRAHESAVLDHYAWADRGQGVIRMPIDDAMAVVLERGLPVRTEAPAAVAAPAPSATASPRSAP